VLTYLPRHYVIYKNTSLFLRNDTYATYHAFTSKKLRYVNVLRTRAVIRPVCGYTCDVLTCYSVVAFMSTLRKSMVGALHLRRRYGHTVIKQTFPLGTASIPYVKKHKQVKACRYTFCEEVFVKCVVCMIPVCTLLVQEFSGI
jgi:hypothetical protein